MSISGSSFTHPIFKFTIKFQNLLYENVQQMRRGWMFIIFHFGGCIDYRTIGGYSHAPNDLIYGIDMKKVRWCGILQVFPLTLSFLYTP
jgi:hypothetical protein